MRPIAGVARVPIFDFVLGQVQRAFVAKLLAARFAHEHNFVEEKDVTTPLARILILVSLDAQNAVALADGNET